MRWLLLFFGLLGFAPLGHAATLETGDVLLMSVPCYVCSLIEIEEGVPYSHSAVVFRDGPRVDVLESWGEVKRTPIEEFLRRRRPQTRVAVLRARDGSALAIRSNEVWQLFEREFQGKGFDDVFLWNNRDERGELFYCSEFVAKFLNRFIVRPFLPKPMHYQKHREDWSRYFRGVPPDGKPGIAPGDFLSHPDWVQVGDI